MICPFNIDVYHTFNDIFLECNFFFLFLLVLFRYREAWCAVVRGVAKSWTWLSDWTTIINVHLFMGMRIEDLVFFSMNFSDLFLYLFDLFSSFLPFTSFMVVSRVSWLPRWLSGKEFACPCRGCGFDPWVGKIPWGGNGNPLQYSRLENSMDRGAWCTIVHVFTKSQTQLWDWARRQECLFKNFLF